MDPYQQLRAHYDAIQERAREWRAELDAEERPLVEQAYGAHLRGRLSISEARSVLGYPEGATIDPFEYMRKTVTPDNVDTESDLLYEAWSEQNDMNTDYTIPCHR